MEESLERAGDPVLTIQPGDIVKILFTMYEENNHLGVISRITAKEPVLEIALITPILKARSDYEGYVIWANPKDVALVRARPSRAQLAQLITPLPFGDLFLRLAKKYLRVSSPNSHQLRAVKRMLVSIIQER